MKTIHFHNGKNSAYLKNFPIMSLKKFVQRFYVECTKDHQENVQVEYEMRPRECKSFQLILFGQSSDDEEGNASQISHDSWLGSHERMNLCVGAQLLRH
jgi:hypothetical protein